MRKRRIGGLLAVFVMSAVLGGCGGRAAAAPDSVSAAKDSDVQFDGGSMVSESSAVQSDKEGIVRESSAVQSDGGSIVPEGSAVQSDGGSVIPQGSDELSDTGNADGVFSVTEDSGENASPEEEIVPEVPGMTDRIDPEGNTLETRIRTPKGYVRTKAEKDSFMAFLRDYGLKPDRSPVLLYDGTEKGDQSFHAAIFTLPLEEVDLQQCADSVMRMYAEYYWHRGVYDKIRFHFVSGFLAEYEKWREGWRIKVKGNDVSWTKSASFDDSYASFQSYMRMVFTYASTLSMAAEAEEIALDEAAVGDVFLKGGSPGHVVMIVDECVDQEGKKAFLLAQGYMPAQEFHVLNNFLHGEDPWYYEEEIQYPFVTPGYVFDEGSLVRLVY